MQKHPLVHILVLNWNGKRDTLACLASLRRLDYPRFRVLVVDNASSDGSVAAIRKRFPSAVVLQNRENLGFAGGNNAGFRHALRNRADYVFLLNNDTAVAPGCLSRLVAFAQAHPKAAAVGPKIYYSSKPDVLWSAGSRLILGKSRLRGRGQRDRGQFDSPWLAPQVVGAACLFRVEALGQAGLFDEDYFAYYEETKLCTRLRKAGWEVWYCPDAKVWHKVAASTGGGSSPTSVYYLVRNRAHFIADELPLLEKPFAYALWVLEVIVRKILYLAQGRPALARAAAQGAFDALLGRRGKKQR